MDFAKCLIDKKNYKAFDFSKLSNIEIANKRRFLVCKECEGPAFFRKASKSGQSACFGARPHKDDCTLASLESESSIGKLTSEEEGYLNSGKEIIIDFNYGSKEIIHTINSDSNDIDNKSKAKQYSYENGIKESNPHRRLSTFLRALIHDKDYFKDSKQNINLNGYIYNAKKLFKHFNTLSNDYVSNIVKNTPYTYRAVWGMISDAKYSNDDKSSIWINTGGNDKISLLVDSSIFSIFLERFKIKEIEDLSGKYILSISKLGKSKNNKIYSKIEDISYLAVV